MIYEIAYRLYGRRHGWKSPTALVIQQWAESRGIPHV